MGAALISPRERPCERKISSLGVDFDAIEFHNAIQWLGTGNAMKSGAADGKLSICVEPLYSAPGERVKVFAVFDAGVEVDPAVAEPVRAYLTIKYEAYSIEPAPSIRGTALLKPTPS